MLHFSFQIIIEEKNQTQENQKVKLKRGHSLHNQQGGFKFVGKYFTLWFIGLCTQSKIIPYNKYIQGREKLL